MLIKLENPKEFVDAIFIISELVSEVKMKFLEDALSIAAIDPANVAMVIFKMPKEAFSVYNTNNDEFSVNLEDLKKVLRRTSSSSSINFELDEGNLKITVVEKSKRVFNISLIELDKEEKKEPNLEFSSRVEIPSLDFSQTIEDCSIVADSCTFLTKNGEFIIEAKGNLNSAKIEFSKDITSVEGEAKAKYSLEYLMKFIKASKISEKAYINFSNDYPLKIEFPGEKLGMSFILAPRVDND